MKHNSQIGFLFLLVLAACAVTPPSGSGDHRNLSAVSFDELPGWQSDQTASALAAFRHSCTALKGAWEKPCAQAAQTPDDDGAARAFFEQNFQPYAVASNEGEEGLFTGYYVPELRGSLQRGGAFQTPLYAHPSDLISVDLGLFKNELKGQHIVGKVTGTKFVPYDDRAAIAKNGLDNRATPLAWVDDPASAFFLQVQGSGRIRLDDGTVLPIGYDGVNGHSYVAIGRVLADRGELQKPVTMTAIRAWLAAHPDRAQSIMNADPSYVFFRRLPDDNVLGAEGVALTALRSLAVDPAFMTLGAPVWLDTVDGHGNALRRLMVAQDTGGAIKGVVRGDVFWGTGADAAAQAGAMQSHGRYYELLPKSITPNE